MWEECPFCRINYKLTYRGLFRKHNRVIGRRGYYAIKETCPGSGNTTSDARSMLQEIVSKNKATIKNE